MVCPGPENARGATGGLMSALWARRSCCCASWSAPPVRLSGRNIENALPMAARRPSHGGRCFPVSRWHSSSANVMQLLLSRLYVFARYLSRRNAKMRSISSDVRGVTPMSSVSRNVAPSACFGTLGNTPVWSLSPPPKLHSVFVNV